MKNEYREARDILLRLTMPNQRPRPDVEKEEKEYKNLSKLW
jgi:hypothetical protein